MDAKEAERRGWIKARFVIEALGVSAEVSKSALEKHVAKLRKEKSAILTYEQFRDIRKVTQPVPQVPEAYSCIVELELLAERFENLLYLVIAYGPTSAEVLAPPELKLKMGEAQTILNGIADLVHRFAAAGAGGMVITA